MSAASEMRGNETRVMDQMYILSVIRGGTKTKSRRVENELYERTVLFQCIMQNGHKDLRKKGRGRRGVVLFVTI